MLDPQTRALLDLIESRALAPTHTLAPAEARASYRDRRFYTQPKPPAVSLVRDLAAVAPQGTIPLRLYRPLHGAPDTALPVLVFFHGGGYVIGDLDTHDVLARELANGSGCAVVAVDYRLAPEHPFPHAIDDALAAVRWVRAHAADLALDATRIAVGGDSAGGNLAAVVAQLARDAGDPPLAFQLLIYPATDQRCDTPSHRACGQGYLLTRETIDYFIGHYLPGHAERLDPRASPLLREDLSRLPPALVLTAGYDPLRDEGLQYSQRLSEAGNRVAHVCFERQIHGFVTMGRVIDEANVAVAMCAAALRRAVTPAGARGRG